MKRNLPPWTRRLVRFFPSIAAMSMVFTLGIVVGLSRHAAPILDVGTLKALHNRVGLAPVQGVRDFEMYMIAPLLALTDKTTDRQVRAIHSWTQLVPRPKIYLATENLTDFRVFKSMVTALSNVDADYIDIAEVEWIEFDDPRLTKVRLPVLTSMFGFLQNKAAVALQPGVHPIFTYVNSDIFLFEEFARAARRVAGLGDFKRYLMVGERMEYWFNSTTTSMTLAKVREATLAFGHYRGRWAVDYFTFGPETWSHIPRFVIGRPRFDNWLVANARGVRVDATLGVVAMHTIHDYSHAGATEGIRDDFKSPIIEEKNPGRNYNEQIIKAGRKDDVYYREGSLNHLCLKLKPSRDNGFCFYRADNTSYSCTGGDLQVHRNWVSGAKGDILCGK